MPDKWTTTTLGEVAEWYSGGTPKAGEPKFYHGGTIPWVVIADMANGEIRETETSITRDGLEQIGGRLAPVESTLVSMYATVGRAAITHIPVATNQAIAWSVVDQKRMIPRFLFLIAQSLEKEIASAARGATQRNINRAMLREFQFQLPTLIEQRRIVDLVSSVDSYIFALQQQADAARAARNAVLSELLSAGGEDWIETTLGEVAELNPEATKNFPADQVIRYIDLASVSHETGISQDLTEVKYGDAPGRARRVVRVADVLVSTVRPYLKGFALVPKDLDGGVASTGFAVVRAKPDKTLPGFIWAFVGLEPFVLHLMDRATGSNYPAVRPEDIASFKLMLPPIAEQKRIVDLVSSMDDMIKTTHHAVSNATRMRSGLLSDLLSGKHEIPESYDRLLGAT
jgi:type I restriction enzyme S subunit